MRIDLLTLFPESFTGPFTTSILKRAQQAKLVEMNLINIRDFTHDKHHTADDRPYGGGAGMVMKPDPIFEACESIGAFPAAEKVRVILTCPTGKVFSQKLARELSMESRLVFICGHYEGIDDRVRQQLVTDELSIGDYVLTGGELAAMVMVDAVVRLIPGVLGHEESALKDSFSDGLLEYPHYTRPEEFRGMKVPEVLLSGNHQEIEKWRKKEALKRTLKQRPDLLSAVQLTSEEEKLLEEIQKEN